MRSLLNPAHWQLFVSVFSIIAINLALSGDNAVVIAVAVRTLPRAMRRRALIAGAGCTVFTLVVAAFFATRLLRISFLQAIGGLAILWIAAGLFREEPPLEASATHVAGFWKALWFIVVADVTMSTDNVLAVAAIAQGNFYFLLFGLGLSIPLVIFASGMLAELMDRYPVIIFIGAALLGRVAGQMIMTDPWVVRRFAPGPPIVYGAEAVGTIGIVLFGLWLKKRRARSAS